MAWKLVELEIERSTIRAIISDDLLEIELIADLELEGQMAQFHNCHFLGLGANQFGVSRLRSLAKWVKEQLDVGQLKIEGATRTSGANPGRRPGPLIF